MEDNNRYNFNSSDLLFRVFKYRKILILTSGIAALASLIVAFLITEKFESSVVMFPAPSTSISKSLISYSAISSSTSVYGEEEEVEQLLQVLHSDELHKLLVDKHDLMSHYEIDNDDPHKYSKLRKTYDSQVKFKRTEFMSVEISVLDKDPQMAADIANNAVAFLDTVMNKMEKKRAKEAFAIVEETYQQKLKELSHLKDSLRDIMRRGVFDYESQSEVYTSAYADALAKGNLHNAKIIQQKLDTLAEYGGAYVSIRDYLDYEYEQLSLLKMKHREAKVDAEQSLPHAFVINKAQVPDKKAYPKKLTIIVLTTLATFALTFITLIVLENIKQYKAIDQSGQ